MYEDRLTVERNMEQTAVRTDVPLEYAKTCPENQDNSELL